MQEDMFLLHGVAFIEHRDFQAAFPRHKEPHHLSQ